MTRRADKIADAIEEQIAQGELGDRTRLDEASLAARFDVSRTPIREALQKLAQSGLVEQIPHRGVFVRHPSPVELAEIFEVMAELEAAAARRAADRINEEGLSELRIANMACAEALAERDPDAYYRENERFHRALYKHSGNAFLESECLRLQRRLRPFRRLQLRLRGRLVQSMAEHKAIVSAIASGDGEQAAREARQHVTTQIGNFQDLMSSTHTEVAE